MGRSLATFVGQPWSGLRWRLQESKYTYTGGRWLLTRRTRARCWQIGPPGRTVPVELLADLSNLSLSLSLQHPIAAPLPRTVKFGIVQVTLLEKGSGSCCWWTGNLVLQLTTACQRQEQARLVSRTRTARNDGKTNAKVNVNA